MPSVAILLLLAVSALVTSFISGILGMAGGMILMGILLAVMPLPVAMMLHGITQLASNGWRALMWRREVDWRVFRGYLYGTIVTTILFVVVKLVVSKPIALVAMGLTPFITLALPEKLHLNVERAGTPPPAASSAARFRSRPACRGRSSTSSSFARRWDATR